MRKQVTPRKLVSQSELGPESFEPLEALPIALLAILNLDNEVIVRVAAKARETVAGDLVLEVDLGHRRAVVVRVQALFGRNVLESDDHPIGDVGQLVFPVWRLGGVPRGHIEHSPFVVGVPVRVQCDLLLIAPAWVVVCVRVEVAALRVQVADGDGRANSDV